MIRIGGSCGGRFSRPIAGITCYENRILQNNEHSYFWTDSKFCIDNKIFLIVNIDTYLTGGRWKPSNQVLRDFTIATKNRLKSYGANKLNCRFTFDNESDEYLNENFEAYYNYTRVIHDALGGEFDLGAGNFRTARIDWYNTLGSKYAEKYYEVLDIHFQDGMDNTASIVSIANKFKAIKDGWNIKRIAVTEGNNFWNVSTQQGHDLVKYQINVAESIGCEDFCIVFINWTTNNEEGHGNLTYCIDNTIYSPYWTDMKNIILQKKPIIKEDMELENFYYRNRPTYLIKRDPKGYGIAFLRKCFGLSHGFTYDMALENKVKEYQSINGLLVDGKVGKETFGDMILKEDYYKFYCWSHSLWARNL